MKGEKGFDDAQGDMKEAEGDLKGGKAKPAKAGRAGRAARAPRSTRKAERSRRCATAPKGCRSR